MEVNLAAMFFGIFIGIFIFTSAKAARQTHTVWNNTRSLRNPYLFLIWGEALANLIFAICTVLFMSGVIEGGLWFYVLTVVLWSFQVQLLPQIIANRLALIMANPRKASALKLGLLVVITPICICVCYIWTVAHLEGATQSQIRRNFIFEKFEKTFFLVIDLMLNIYFLFLVRYKLIASGLSKYWTLFKFNVAMVVISTTLDALLLGFLSLPNEYVYVQYSSAAYISKLYIELVMASLIAKIVRRSVNEREPGHSSSIKDKYTGSNVSKHRSAAINSGWRKASSMKVGRDCDKKSPTVREGSNGSDIHLTTYDEFNGITKTVEHTAVVETSMEGDIAKTTSKYDRSFVRPGRTLRQSF